MSKITYTDKEYIYENASVPEINKITDGNMNEIKSVVNENDTRLTTAEGEIDNLDNVTKYITATAGSNGDFYVDIPNTLATGIIVNIIFPVATVSTDNARLSIDGGITYTNIFRKVDNTQIKAVSVQSSYQELYYDGTNFIFDYSNCVILYSNDTGSNETITLSDSALNYNKLEIVFKDNDGYFANVIVNSPNGKKTNLSTITNFDASVFIKGKLITISGTSISNFSTAYSQVRFSGTSLAITNVNLIYITKVIGWL